MVSLKAIGGENRLPKARELCPFSPVLGIQQSFLESLGIPLVWEIRAGYWKPSGTGFEWSETIPR